MTRIMECYRIQVFENKQFTSTKDMKQQFWHLEHEYSVSRCNATSSLGIQDKTVESCRRCTELELAQVVSGKTSFIDFIGQLTSPPLTIAKLRNDVTDEAIWKIVSIAAKFADYASPQTLYCTKLCPVCAARDNLTLCSCRTAAYCSFEHHYSHWERHN